MSFSLQSSHNGCDGISNHQPHDCLLNCLFRHWSKKTSKLHITGLCTGNSPVTGEFPAQMASNAENVSIWWRHHVCQTSLCGLPGSPPYYSLVTQSLPSQHSHWGWQLLRHPGLLGCLWRKKLSTEVTSWMCSRKSPTRACWPSKWWCHLSFSAQKIQQSGRNGCHEILSSSKWYFAFGYVPYV